MLRLMIATVLGVAIIFMFKQRALIFMKTKSEIAIVLGFLLTIALYLATTGLCIYVVYHFVSKYW